MNKWIIMTVRRESIQTLRYKNSANNTHVLIDVKERCHDGILNSSQIWLVPVNVKHPSYAVAAGIVTGDVLQEEGLLVTDREKQRERETEQLHPMIISS